MAKKTVVKKVPKAKTPKAKATVNPDPCTDTRLKAMVQRWHEDSIKYEYYYHPVTRALRATLGMAKHGDDLLVTFSIASPKEKEVTKDKARMLINNRLGSFIKYMNHTRVEVSHPPIFVIRNWKRLFKTMKFDSFKDFFSLAVAEFVSQPDIDVSTTNQYDHFCEVFSKNCSKFDLRTMGQNK